MKRIAIWFMLIPWMTWAQDVQPDPEVIADQIALLQDEDDVSEDHFENLTHLLSNPININKASAEDLRFPGILSDEQANAIITHREKYGPFVSILELQSIPTLDAEQLRKLLPFIQVRDPSTEINRSLLSRIRDESDTYILLRYETGLENKKGFSSSTRSDQRFNGGSGKSYFRFRSSKPGDFSFGITAENDPGESFRWDPSRKMYGADYVSFHAQTLNKGAIQNFIIGDYQAQFGQGLVWGGISGSGKNAETITSVRRCNLGYVPYTSAYESGNLRGLAATFKLKPWLKVSVAYSNLHRDATVTAAGEVSSLQLSGLHRNEDELQKRKSLREGVIGAAAQFQRNAFDGGITLQHIGFNRRITPEPRLYSTYAFRGYQNTNLGVYANYTYRNISVFSEAANTLGYGFAVLAGALIAVTPKMDVCIIHRTYAQDYQPFYSNAVSENTKAQNERGTYWGWKYRFNRRWTYSGYVDLFSFDGLKFRTYAPSRGYEWLMRLNWQPTRSILLYLQARQENKARNVESDRPTYRVANSTKNNFWFTAEYGIGQKFRFRTRVLTSQYNSEISTTYGFALAQDLGMQFNRWKISARYALFDTDDWDNRQYLYEQDVWLAYSLPAYDGVGIRKILVLEYKVNRTFTFWLRCAQTRYTDRKEIGSGMDQIFGDTRNDIKLQARIRF
jgi:hypothetical protein